MDMPEILEVLLLLLYFIANRNKNEDNRTVFLCLLLHSTTFELLAVIMTPGEKLMILESNI